MEFLNAVKRVIKKYEANEGLKEDERSVIGYYSVMFNPSNLRNLTDDMFKSFLLFRNNRHWAGIHRWGNMITSDMDKLRNALKILLDESKPIQDRLYTLRPQNRPPYIKGLGRAVLTPILLMVYPGKYAVYNGVTEMGLKMAGAFPKFNDVGFAEQYIRINEKVVELAKENRLSLWQMDQVWWEVTKN